MEKNLIIFNLGEAELQLKKILDKFKINKNYDVTEFQIDIQHMMIHINTAYNIRTWEKDKIEKDYSNSFDQIIKVPEDKYLID